MLAGNAGWKENPRVSGEENTPGGPFPPQPGHQGSWQEQQWQCRGRGAGAEQALPLPSLPLPCLKTTVPTRISPSLFPVAAQHIL